MNLLIRSCVCSFAHFISIVPLFTCLWMLWPGVSWRCHVWFPKMSGTPLKPPLLHQQLIRRADFLTAEVPTWEHEEEVSSSWRCMGRTAFWENCPLMVFSFLASWRCCVACSRGRPVKCQVLASSSSTSSSDLAWNSLNGTPIGLLDMKHSETISSTFVGDWS